MLRNFFLDVGHSFGIHTTNTSGSQEIRIMNPDEVITAETGLIQLLQGFQATHRQNIANANAPVDAANAAVTAAQQAITDAQTALTTAQANVTSAEQAAAATVASETAVITEDQQAIDAANAVIVSLGGTPVPNV